MEAYIERSPDALLSELQDALWDIYEEDVSAQTVLRTLLRRGLTRKKVRGHLLVFLVARSYYPIQWKLSREAVERNENVRDAYHAFVGLNYRADQLVFVDESACNRHTTKRLLGWATLGNRAQRRDFFIRGQRCVSYV